MMVTASLFWSAIRNRYYYIVSTAIFFYQLLILKLYWEKKCMGFFFVWTRFYYCDVLFFTPGIWTRGWPDGKLQKLSGCRPTSPAILISLVGKPVVYKNNRDLRIKTEPVVGQILCTKAAYILLHPLQPWQARSMYENQIIFAQYTLDGSHPKRPTFRWKRNHWRKISWEKLKRKNWEKSI